MIKLPDPDPRTLQRRDEIIRAMRGILTDPDSVLTHDIQLRPYECDGLSAYRQLPLIVVLPGNSEEVSAILRYCEQHQVRIVPRGAGTGVSGGATPLADAITISMMKMNRILEIDLENRCAVVEPGVTNQAISDAVDDLGFYYAPDPSSQFACSIGGNVAENSGGIHCLKYGMTTNNVIGIKLVMLGGEIINLGGKAPDPVDYDLLGIANGSEGMLGVVTEVTVKLLRKSPQKRAVLLGFPSLEQSGECVAAIIAAGIIPAALEMMDKKSTNAIEDAVGVGYPRHVDGVLICELDGDAEEAEHQLNRVIEIARDHGASHIEPSENVAQRLRFWKGRRALYPALTSLAPDFLTMDGTVPRRQIAHVIRAMQPLGDRYGLQIATVFHAGDGNIHPSVLFDSSQPGQQETAEALCADIMRLCLDAGGVLTGEHGVGLEKRELMNEMFTEDDLKQQQRLKCAFDEYHLLNPGKVFPTLRRCGELKPLEARRQVARFPDLERF